ncbi:aggregation-promoting factor C-terminal-like domain-containing protein [Microbacterium gorillae]|uniref:aggregation-promoting factor C-terminal-like domain-containing protein n=1 Tax=Microbacterium gorillae TaxID=1231063 RepID=UPI000693CC5B|nr:hypothetical protein [Microbacterium gorillae]
MTPTNKRPTRLSTPTRSILTVGLGLVLACAASATPAFAAQSITAGDSATASAAVETIAAQTQDADQVFTDAQGAISDAASAVSEAARSTLDLTGVEKTIDTSTLSQLVEKNQDLRGIPGFLLTQATTAISNETAAVEAKTTSLREGIAAAQAKHDAAVRAAAAKAAAEKAAAEKAAAEKKAAEEEAARQAAEEAKQKADEEAQQNQNQNQDQNDQGSDSSGSSGNSNPSAPVPSGSGDNSPSGAKATAYGMLSSYGWGDDQWGCLESLWNRESGWNYQAYNPSGAFGIPQALPGSKMASAGSDWETNAATQIAWGLGYISNTYGTPCGAWGHSESSGWY